MIFGPKEIYLNDGRSCILRSPSVLDAEDILEYLKITSSETDFMIRCPEEVTMTVAEEQIMLAEFLKDPKRVMISAILDGKIVGNAGLGCIDDKIKLCHRAHFGIAIIKEAWHLGIGSAILEEIINTARSMGFEQIELEVDENNQRGISLYQKKGFKEYGKREAALRLKDGSYHAEYLMMKKL